MRGVKFLTILAVVFCVFLGSVVWAGGKGEKSRRFVVLPQKYQVLSLRLFEYHNGYLIISNLFSETGPDSFSQIINVNSNGTVVWSKIIGRKAPNNWISKVIYIPDRKSFVLLGTVNYKFYYGGIGSGWIVVMDENGKVLWDKAIKEGRITQIVDGFIYSNDLFVAGNVYNSKEEESFKNSFLMKVDMKGRIVFSKNYPFKIDLIEKNCFV